MSENNKLLNDDNELLNENNLVDIEEVVEESNDTLREEEIEFRISEINVIFDDYQNKLYDQDIETLTKEECEVLKEELNELKKELKALKKTNHNTFWDKVKVWMLIYGFAQFLICVPGLGLIYQLCISMYNKLYEWFGDTLTNLDNESAMVIEILMLIAFPIINLFISWIVYANFVSKKKLDQVVYISIWIMQAVLSVISMLLVFSV